MHTNDDLRPLVLPAVPVAAVVRSVQHLSSSWRGGRERGGADKRRRSNTSNNSRDGKEKEEYTFLEKDDLGRLSNESKVLQREEREALYVYTAVAFSTITRRIVIA